jgi:hypothetical protein
MLKSYRDGDPIPELRSSIEAHLDLCEFCRMELRRLQGEPEPALCHAAPESDTDGLSDLLSRIRTWESSLPEPGQRGPAIRTRAARELGLYLGGNAAERIIRPVSDDAGNLLPAIQPFLGLFLGRKAASHLSSHIIDVAVVRR